MTPRLSRKSRLALSHKEEQGPWSPGETGPAGLGPSRAWPREAGPPEEQANERGAPEVWGAEEGVLALRGDAERSPGDQGHQTGREGTVRVKSLLSDGCVWLLWLVGGSVAQRFGKLSGPVTCGSQELSFLHLLCTSLCMCVSHTRSLRLVSPALSLLLPGLPDCPALPCPSLPPREQG